MFWPVASYSFVLVISLREDFALSNLASIADNDSRYLRNVGTNILILRIIRQEHIPHGKSAKFS